MHDARGLPAYFLFIRLIAMQFPLAVH